MKNRRNLFALPFALACLTIIGMVTASANNPNRSAHGSARSGNLKLTFNAMQHQDGSIGGHAAFRDLAAGTTINIDIECLNVGRGAATPGGSSIDALLIGVVNQSTSDDFPTGIRVGFLVKDFGQGQNAPPDQFTTLGLAGEDCGDGTLTGEILESEQGNIVVISNENKIPS